MLFMSQEDLPKYNLTYYKNSWSSAQAKRIRRRFHMRKKLFSNINIKHILLSMWVYIYFFNLSLNLCVYPGISAWTLFLSQRFIHVHSFLYHLWWLSNPDLLCAFLSLPSYTRKIARSYLGSSSSLLHVANQVQCTLSRAHSICTVILLLQVSIWGGQKAQNNLNGLSTSLSTSVKPQFVLCSSQNDFSKVHTSDKVLDMFKRQKKQQKYQEARAKNARPEH